MKLLVDIGNTRVKWALESGAGPAATGAAWPSSLDTLSADLDRYWIDLERPSAVLVCNVMGPAVEAVFNAWTAVRWDIAPVWIRSAQAACGIVNAYADPSRLGADRWVAMIGAQSLFGPPVCVVSLGTALTVDLVAAGGRHCGGLIAPGLSVMRDSLLRRAGGVKPESAVDRADFWGRDSGACLESGVLQMALALIERAFRQAESDLHSRPMLVLTGGDAATVSPLLSLRHELVPDLVLQGLARCA